MKRIVVKIGGALLGQPLEPLFEALATLQQESEVVLVHGGGPQATAMAKRLGHSPNIIEGRRVTTDIDLDIVKWMIRGQLNVELVAEASKAGIRSLGLSGADAGLIQVSKRGVWTVGTTDVDFGHVGDFQKADPTVLMALLQAGIMPVICPPGIDQEGHLYNINADTIALEVASALNANELLLVTETGAVLNNEMKPLRRLSYQQTQAGVEEGWIASGMKVKTDIGFAALERGISSVWILGPESVASRIRGTQLLGAHHA